MQKNRVELSYWLIQGWLVYRNNLKGLIVVTTFVFIASWIRWLLGFLPYTKLVYSLFWEIAGPPLLAGYSFYCLSLVRGCPTTYSKFMEGFRRFVVVWLTCFLLSIMVLCGLILFIVPGIILSLKYGMSLISVLDKKFSLFKAIKYSGVITCGYKGKLFSLLAFTIAISLFQFPFYHSMLSQTITFKHPFMIISLFLYVMSIFTLIPWVSVAWAIAYDTLSERYEQIDVLPRKT